MSKTLALYDGLEDIKKELLVRGYNVVASSYDRFVDAILYNSDKERLSYLNKFDNVIDMDKGAILVNTKDKTIDEIIYYIENRKYENLL